VEHKLGKNIGGKKYREKHREKIDKTTRIRGKNIG